MLILPAYKPWFCGIYPEMRHNRIQSEPDLVPLPAEDDSNCLQFPQEPPSQSPSKSFFIGYFFPQISKITCLASGA